MSQSPEGQLKLRLPGHIPPESLIQLVLGGPENLPSVELPGDTEAAGPGATHGECQIKNEETHFTVKSLPDPVTHLPSLFLSFLI